MEKIYTLKELKTVLGLSTRTLIRYIHSGRLEAVKMGTWRVTESALNRFLHPSGNTAAARA